MTIAPERTRTIAWDDPLPGATGPVQCEGRVIHVGSRVATAEGRLTDSAGKLYGHATTTCLLLSAAPPEEESR